VLDRAPAEECGVISFSLGGLMKRFVTRALIVVAASLGIVFAQVAPASATPANKLTSTLVASWTKVLQTPANQSPYGTGGPETGCVDLGGTLAPGWPIGYKGVRSCTVKPGTKIFVTASSFECSTLPGDDHPAGDPPFTDEQLAACAQNLDATVKPTVTLDGRSVPVTEVVETPAFEVVLPANNIFGTLEGTQGRSVAHGWVALLNPLTPGQHEIFISGNIPENDNTTTITVVPGH
jgi:hypothetical protein